MEKRKKLTIITESIIESFVLADLERLGAKGFTVLETRGKGARGVRDADWDQSKNIQIDIVCDETVATAIVRHCTEKYYANYAMILYTSDVEVIRPGKF